MRKILIGLVASAAIAAPLVFATSANAAVTYESTCTPVAAQEAKTKTEYKYSPVIHIAGPTQWADKNAWPYTLKSFEVKGKKVAYFRDGTKTRTVSTPAVEATTCGVKLSDPSGTHVNLPDVFDIEHTESDGTYWSTQVAVTVTNDTVNAQEFRVRYADVQDGDRVWVERAIFTDGQPGNVVPAGSSRVMVFDVWHNAVSTSDVPDELALDFGFELVPMFTRVNLPDVFTIEHADEYPEGTYWATQVSVDVVNPTDTAKEFRVRYADVQDGDRVWVERAIFTDGQPGNVVPANSSRTMVFDVWHNVVSGSDVPDDLTLDYMFEIG